MTVSWELLIDADMTETDWQFSAPTTANLLRIEQVDAPDIGRFALGQATVAEFDFLDIKAYPARAESTRITLDAVGVDSRRIAIRYRYGEFPNEVPNTWRVRVYGSALPFEPLINPSAVVLTLDPRIAGAIPLGEKGVPLGVASLDENGLVEEDQLPSTGLAELVAANLEAVDALSNQIESLSPPPTLESLGAEPVGAELRAKAYTDEQVGAIAVPPPPTLEGLGAEPAGAELRAKAYVDEQVGAIAVPPLPTLESLGAEPAGAELRAKAYVDGRFPIISPPSTEIRINCGGSIAYTDVNGKVWGIDQYFEFGSADASYSGVVGATYDFFLFNRSRSGGTTFSYKIPVPNGNYKVELGFSENWHTNVNSRRFHVDIEGVRVLTDFDIRAQSGMRYSAIKRIFDVAVTDGLLNIIFTPVVDGAQINNIYVYSV